MQRVIDCNEQDMLKEINYIKEFHFNRIPKPFNIVSREEYEDYEDTYCPDFIGIGQIHNDDEKELLLGKNVYTSTVHMKYRFYSTRGYAKCKFRKRVGEGRVSHYVDDVVYIRFGCDHKGAKLIESDRFERVYKCEKCGLTWSEQTGY